MLRLITFNVNGIRSAAKRGFFVWLVEQRAHVVCIQDLKIQPAEMKPEMLAPKGYRGWFHYAQKRGYSGVGIYARRKPDRVVEGLSIPDIDAEGRYLQADFGPLSIVSLYLPSGSSGAERQAIKFRFMERFLPHLQRLRRSRRKIIICGDWNIAHKEIDLKNWRSNQKNSGFLPEERAWISCVFDQCGYVDVFRRLSASPEQYTFWSNRGQAWLKNVGWRIDYQVATPDIAAAAKRAAIYKDTRFSDHAPLTIDYDYKL
jgi:exodeoxyribonuclease-3